MLTLQINTSGAWRNLLRFEPARRADVLRATRIFAGVLGEEAKWCIVDADGKREWLPGDLGPWQAITAAEPAPLEDVLVSAWHPGDEQPMVYAAYRSQRDPSQWIISGGDCERVTGVYAWAPCPDAAALPVEAKQVAA